MRLRGDSVRRLICELPAVTASVSPGMSRPLRFIPRTVIHLTRRSDGLVPGTDDDVGDTA
jgi:hypothetical protein